MANTENGKTNIEEMIESGELVSTKGTGDILEIGDTAVHRLMRAHGFTNEIYGNYGTYYYWLKDIMVVKERRKYSKAVPKADTTSKVDKWRQPNIDGLLPLEEGATIGATNTLLEAGVPIEMIDYLFAKAEERAYRWSPNLDR